MGSRRYWIVVGVLAAVVGLVVFAVASLRTPDVPESRLANVGGEPSTSTTTSSTTSTPAPRTTSTLPPPTTSTLPPPTTSTLPSLPMVEREGPDWLWFYDPPPEVLFGQVVDLDDDGEPDVALFGERESPLIYPIEDDDDDVELAATRARVADLEGQIGKLAQVTEELRDQLGNIADSSTVENTGGGVRTASPPGPEGDLAQSGDDLPPDDSTTTTTIKAGEGSRSSGLTPTQESLLLAFISTAGVVLVGIGAPVISAWAKRKYGTSAE